MTLKFCAFLTMVAFLFFCGCGPHRGAQIIFRTDVTKYFDAPIKAKHNNRVFVTEEPMAENEYETLAEIHITKTMPWINGWVLDDLADSARKIGADAVIEADVWWKWFLIGYVFLGVFGWGPQGYGKAVALNSAGIERLACMQGEYR